MHAALETAAQQGEFAGVSAGAAAGDGGADGSGAEAGEVGAVHDGQGDAGVDIVADLDACDIGQAMGRVFGKTADPFQTTGTELLQISGHGVDEIVRIGAGGVDANFGMHFIGAIRVFLHGLFHRAKDFFRLEIEADDVLLGQKGDFNVFHGGSA